MFTYCLLQPHLQFSSTNANLLTSVKFQDVPMMQAEAAKDFGA
jgi:hypothetical protein